MVIGPSFLFRRCQTWGLAALVCGGLVIAARADEIKKTNGTVVNGQITGISGGQVAVSIASGNTVVYLSDIQSVTMSPPAAFSQLKESAPPATIVSTLEPLVKEYAGLPADWVLQAMSELADAYDAQGFADKSAAVYTQINTFYPNSPLKKMGVIGQAKLAVQQGKIQDALAAVKPLVDEANQNLAPSADEGRLYAGAFLVYGQALEAQKQYPQALEAYLTVKTMFYQNPALVDQADQFAKKLRAQQPGVGVD
jgi:tetratricopeptide (TPR) repeat protein